jgi:hypothetical protein
MLMDANEHLILMDYPKADNTLMSVDDLQPLFDAGIRTAQICVMNWHQVETVEGITNWSEVDDRVYTLNRIGYKVLLNCYTEPALYFPPEYYARSQEGPCMQVLSPWNQDAQKASLDFYTRMRNHFNSKTCLVVNANLTHGETVYLHGEFWYDPAAIESFHRRWNTEDMPVPNEARTEEWMKETFINLMVSQNKILAVNSGNEIWSMLHPQIAVYNLYGNGCKFLEDIYNAYEREIPGVNMSQIWYTYIQHANQYPNYTRLIQRYNLRAFGGAEYCEGLPQTTQMAVTLGFKGLYIHPLYPAMGRLSIEPWMIENIKNGLKVMENL